jgi:hypothetical protein
MATSSPLALAIANAEGFGNGSAGTALNNPGDIFSGGSLASYPDLQSGWDALESQINRYLNGTSAYAGPNTTLSQLAQTYTGGDNADAWASNVASSLGLSPSATISQAASASPSAGLLSKLGQYLGSGISSGVTSAAKSVFSSSTIARVVVGLVGVVFIVGGIFGFDKVQQVVVGTAQKAAQAGEIAA